MSKEQQGILLFLGLILLCFLVLTTPSFFFPSFSEKINIEKLPKLSPGEILVEVNGLVKKRGIYQLPAGSKIGDVLEKSGGTEGKLSIDREVLEKAIEENRHIHVYGQGKELGMVSVKPIEAPKLRALFIPVNINKATLDELITLPGIGPKTAQAIVDFRNKQGNFKSPEDLLQIHGLGPKKLAAIRERITMQ